MTAARKRSVVATAQGAGDPEAVRIGEALGQATVDAGEDVVELDARGIADGQPRKLLSPPGVAPVVR
jgi:hypothetical protein